VILPKGPPVAVVKGCPFPQPVVNRGFGDARVFCCLRYRNPFLLHAAENVRLHVLGDAMILFGGHVIVMVIPDRPLCLRYGVRVSRDGGSLLRSTLDGDANRQSRAPKSISPCLPRAEGASLGYRGHKDEQAF